MQLTIFTPTYNRAHLLPKLFASLQSQIVKNFEWLIVDDGSTDNTAEIVEKLRYKADFPVRYIYQNNQGKHVATNTAVQSTKTAFFLTIDSDDQLIENAIGKIEIIQQKLNYKSDIAAAVFPRYSVKNQTTKININIPFDEAVLDSIELKKKHNLSGEFDYLFRTEILKKFPFPQFGGEKFLKESVVYKRIDRHYKNLYVNQSIVQGEYLQDGLSSNFRALLEKNPKGSALAYLETANDERLSFEEQKEAFKNYWYFAKLARQDSQIRRLLRIKNKNIIFNFLLQKLR